jgi:hypothetical protein
MSGHSLTILSSLLFAIGTLAANPANSQFVKSSSKNICAGIKEPCTGFDECTTTYVGYCTSTSLVSPSIESHFKSLAAVNPDTFIGGYNVSAVYGTGFSNIPPSNFANNGYRDFSGNLNGDTGIAFTQTGAFFGDQHGGGYVGIASYFNAGNKTFSTNYNTFYVAGHADNTNNMSRVTRHDSTLGAPNGPYEVCVSDVVNGSCGPARNYQPGQYKFSIFGYTDGDDWNNTYTGLVSQYSKLGVVMSYRLIGANVTSLTFNDKQFTLDNLGNNNVENMALGINDDYQLEWHFPTTYNLGYVKADVIPTEANPVKFPTPELGTKTVQVKAKRDTDGNLMLVYLFDFASFSKRNTYFAYDPDIQTTSTSSSTSSFSACQDALSITQCTNGGITTTTVNGIKYCCPSGGVLNLGGANTVSCSEKQTCATTGSTTTTSATGTTGTETTGTIGTGTTGTGTTGTGTSAIGTSFATFVGVHSIIPFLYVIAML